MPGWKGAEEVERLIKEQNMPVRSLRNASFQMRQLAEETAVPSTREEFDWTAAYLREQARSKDITVRYGVYSWRTSGGKTLRETRLALNEHSKLYQNARSTVCIPEDTVAYCGFNRLQEDDMVTGNIEFHNSNAQEYLLKPKAEQRLMCVRCSQQPALSAISNGTLCASCTVYLTTTREHKEALARAEEERRKEQEGEQLLALAAKSRFLPLVCMGCGHVLNTCPDGSQNCTFCHSSGDRWRKQLEEARRARKFWWAQYFGIGLSLFAAIACVVLAFWVTLVADMVFVVFNVSLHLVSRHELAQSQRKYDTDRDRPYEELYEQALYELDPSLTVWRPISSEAGTAGPTWLGQY